MAITEKTKPLGGATPRGFYHFYRLDYTGGFAALLAVKPFANVMCDYACQNAEDQRIEYVHIAVTSLAPRCRQRGDYNSTSYL